jgi:O-antigen/teichoic acid export membrane protein
MSDSRSPSSASPTYSRVATTSMLWHCGYLLTEMINIPTSMVLARLLSPQDFGIVAAAGFFGRFAARLMNFGFNQALIRIKVVRPEHLSSVFIVNMVIGGSAWLVLATTAPWLSAAFSIKETAPVIPVAALGFVIEALGSVAQAVMTRELKFWKGTLAGWLSSITGSVLSIALAWNGFGFWSLVYATLAATLVQSLMLTCLTPWSFRPKFSMAAMREIFSYGMGVHAKRLLEYASLNLDNLVVAQTLGLASLGFYDKAFTLMDKAVTRVNGFGNSVTFRVFALIHEDNERYRRAYCKVVTTVTLLSFPFLVACIVAAPELIGTLYGEAWLQAVIPFQVLCASGMLRMLNAYASSATQASGWIWPEVWRQGAYTVMIVAFIAGLSRWGLPMASAGVLIATAAMTVLMHVMLIRITGLTVRDLVKAQLPALVCCAGLLVVLPLTNLVVRAYVRDPAPWQLLAPEVGAGAVFYLLFLLFAQFEQVRTLVDDAIGDYVPSLAQLVRARA